MIRLYSQRNLSDREQHNVEDFFSHAKLCMPNIKSEWCYYIETMQVLSSHETRILSSIFTSHEQYQIRPHSKFSDPVIEIGPRLTFQTPWSTAALSIIHACGVKAVSHIERSRRYCFAPELSLQLKLRFIASFADAMTEECYEKPLTSLHTIVTTEKHTLVRLIGCNYRQVLETLSLTSGLGWDSSDIEFIGNLFITILKRDPTNIELFQLAQANSEHSRHWLFKGNIVIDDVPMEQSLMEIVEEPLRRFENNSLIAFCDDSSAIRGKKIVTLFTAHPDKKSPYISQHRILHPTLTAETHNFPTGIAPYPGAATGTGGRIRDNEAVGRGGLVIASAAAYCVGNLHIPNHELPWENDSWQHPENLASPLAILIQASNGASDYGNCFGEPVILGFTRTAGLYQETQYRSWFKPIMYTAGLGQMDDAHIHAHTPLRDMRVVLLGGPSYRIGIGGGSASSQTAEAKRKKLDFQAVQRGDPEMGQRLNRVIRACVEMGEQNPLKKIVDLGAGGAANALTELVHPRGAYIRLDALPRGDVSLSALELWINESQERIAAIVHPYTYSILVSICKRERVPLATVGMITDSKNIIVVTAPKKSTVVSLPLKEILGNLPKKSFRFTSHERELQPLDLPAECTLRDILLRVLRLPSIGSKRFLTTKVDRSVTGLVAQQQCVGANHLPLSDFGIVAQSHFSRSGIACSLGEQPLKGLLSPESAAHMAVSEMLLNMAGARITSLDSIKCSANWMLAAKGDDGDGAWLYRAASALRDICIALRIAVDGGKDSLSMSSNARTANGQEQTIFAPPQLVIAGYAPVPDIRAHITPDIKERGTYLLLIDPSNGQCRTGGSALAQVFGQLGDIPPDIEDSAALVKTFQIAQLLAEKGLVLSMHDRSDGGLIVTALEMAFAGNSGLTLRLSGKDDLLAVLFSEEAGLIVETNSIEKVFNAIADLPGPTVHISIIGKIPETHEVTIHWNKELLLSENMTALRSVWEETSAAIDALQANPACVRSEQNAIRDRITPPHYHLTYDPFITAPALLRRKIRPPVAILREEGSNGDREMASAFFTAGFAPVDVTMTDLISKRVSLAEFRGIAFVGGFSFADVPQAGTGWASIIKWNPYVSEQFEQFFAREDTFSLGVCNGCQLMAQMGWVGEQARFFKKEFRFVQNVSGRFESRFSTVRVEKSPSIFFRGMTDSVLGIWVAHGEGRIYTRKKNTLDRLLYRNLTPLHYTDPDGKITEQYPFNPNGSPYGIAAVCSPDGRHLAMMPHPERTFLSWQWPWMPPSFKHLQASPWLRIFQNALAWCLKS